MQKPSEFCRFCLLVCDFIQIAGELVKSHQVHALSLSLSPKSPRLILVEILQAVNRQILRHPGPHPHRALNVSKHLERSHASIDKP